MHLPTHTFFTQLTPPPPPNLSFHPPTKDTHPPTHPPTHFHTQYTQRPPHQHYPTAGQAAKKKKEKKNKQPKSLLPLPKKHNKGGNLFDVMPAGMTRLKKSEKSIGASIIKTLQPGIRPTHPPNYLL